MTHPTFRTMRIFHEHRTAKYDSSHYEQSAIVSMALKKHLIHPIDPLKSVIIHRIFVLPSGNFHITMESGPVEIVDFANGVFL